MKKVTIFICCFVMINIFAGVTTGASEDFFTRDPDAVYDEDYPALDLVIEIPGYKLDPMSALALGVSEEDRDRAEDVDLEILDMAEQYIRDGQESKIEFNQRLYAAKDLGDYILLYFTRWPDVADGAFELIYSKKLKKIIGQFQAGYQG